MQSLDYLYIFALLIVGVGLTLITIKSQQDRLVKVILILGSFIFIVTSILLFVFIPQMRN